MRQQVTRQLAVLALILLVYPSRPSAAAEKMCDPAFENCRTPLLALINSEIAGIDAAWWFMEDSRYASALISRWRAGVPVRIIIDTQANASTPENAQILKLLKDAGIPMREKTTGGILHWKMMLFAGQNQVEFSGANYSADAFVPVDPYVNYVDELIYFTNDPAIVNSFRTKFDDLWTSTTGYSNYANITTPLARNYSTFPISPEMNFPPGSSSVDFATRSVGRYNAETQRIDAIMYRITDRRHTDALINALNRNVQVRLITEPLQYRDPTRLWHSWNVDRLYMAMLDAKARGLVGGSIRHRAHAGLSHEKMTLLIGQGLSIFGSSNWTSPSANSQQEHNIFTNRVWMFQYGMDHFTRKWDNTTGHIETKVFAPLPPDRPSYVSPSNGATGLPQTLVLKWYAGPWAHKYDIYLSTDPASTVPIVADVELGPSESTSDYVTYTLTTPLQSGRQYYWRVVSRTMANLSANGPTWSFVTAGGVPPSNGPGDINLYAANAPVVHGRWSRVADATAAGGFRLSNSDAGAAKILTPAASPVDYFEMTFNAAASTPYHLWVRGKAAGNSYNNDSAYVQFSNSVTNTGAATSRIGSASAASVSIEDCSGCGLAEWGWGDNAYGAAGTPIYFAATGPVTLRVQVREDGLSIDQIMLSPQKFLTTAPGAAKNDATIYPTTGGGAPPPPPPGGGNGTLVIYAGSRATRVGAWTTATDSSAAGGVALVLPNAGRAKVTTAVANPTDYAELTVNVEAGKPYRLWLRGKATSNNYANDSVFVQFSEAVDVNGQPIYRLRTTAAAEVNLEDCGGCGLSGWGWQDNGWGVGVAGPAIYFQTTGTQTIRIQNREDGLMIDELMLSPDAFLAAAPGSLKNDTHIYAEKLQP